MLKSIKNWFSKQRKSMTQNKLSKLNLTNTLEFNLEYDYSTSDSYGSIYIKRCNKKFTNKSRWNDAIKIFIKNSDTSKFLSVTNRIKLSTISSKYIAMVDCDKILNLPLVLEYLEMHKLGYAVIESTPERYWVIVDYSSNNKNKIFNFIERIPGIDEKWCNLSRRRKNIFHLRASSKIIDSQFSSIQPCFPETHTLKDPYVLKWFEAFKSYYECDWAFIHKINIMHEAVRNDTVQQLISSPTF